MKMKFDWNDKLPLIKTIKVPSMVIVVTAIFHENDKYYYQGFLYECLSKL